MVTIYNIKRNDLRNNESYILCELRGLSTDEKIKKWHNAFIENGSAFIEMDTQEIYFYDENTENWVNPNETEGE